MKMRVVVFAGLVAAVFGMWKLERVDPKTNRRLQTGNLTTDIPLRFSTDAVNQKIDSTSGYYWRAEFCGPAANGKMLKLGIVLPFNTEWNKFKGVVYIEVSGSPDWSKNFAGGNYYLKDGEPQFQKEIVVGFNATSFPSDNTVYIRAMAVEQIVTVSLNLDFVPSNKDNPQNIQKCNGSKCGRIPDRNSPVYEELIPYARLSGIGTVDNFTPLYYRAAFCSKPYPGRDWGVRAVVVAADDESAFATYMCSADIAQVTSCEPGSEEVSRCSYNIDDGGINIVSVDTARNPQCDLDKGVLLAVVGFGGADNGKNNFYVQFTTFGL